MLPLVLERILLVAGEPNTGKSVQLRSMFLDPSLGTGGQPPVSRRPPQTYALSASRWLYVRFTSPHEVGKSIRGFMKKIGKAAGSGRWCVAAPVQLTAANKMPDLPTTVQGLRRHFRPERIRVALLCPDRHENLLQNVAAVMAQLSAIPSCECLCIDARSRTANGLLLADTFDFS